MMFRACLTCLLVAISLASLGAASPSWWGLSGTANNYAPANLGQLKYLAKQAQAHLEANLAGGAGGEIGWLVENFEPRAGQGYTEPEIAAFLAENYGPVNLGQLKYVAKPFYDRLLAAGYDTKANLIAQGLTGWEFDYPWDPETGVEANYAPANLGQLKLVFSFDLAGFDSDENGLPDVWEQEHFGWYGVDPEGDEDGDGLTNLEEYEEGSDPNDYFEQGSTTVVPYISMAGGNNQTGTPGQYLAEALSVEVRSGSSTGVVLSNAPVEYNVTSGSSGALGASNEEAYPEATLTIRTGTNGVGQVYFRPSLAGAVNTITATSGTAGPVTFTSQTLGEGGLVGLWRFDEGSGTAIADSSGLVNSGTLGSTRPSFGTGLNGGSALQFSGSGGQLAYVVSGTNSGRLNFGSGSFSTSFWFKSNQATHGRLLGKGAWYGVRGFGLRLTRNAAGQYGRIGFYLTATDAEGPGYAKDLAVVTLNAFNDNEWHHVATVVDREEGEVQMYVDGVAQEFDPGISAGTGLGLASGVAGADISAMTTLDADAAEAVQFGEFQTGGNPYQGSLDEVRAYARALTEEEVEELYQKDGELQAVEQNVTVDEDTLGTITLKHQGGGDVAVATYEIEEEPGHGTVDLVGDTVTYQPETNYSGTDAFRFSVTKGGDISEADVNIIVAPVNDPPVVNAGGAGTVTLPASLNITGTVSDIDNDSEEIAVTWFKESGPGTVTFGAADSLNTTASFGAPGFYILRLSANDGQATRSDTLLVAVNSGTTTNPPTASLQQPANNATYTLGDAVPLQASASAASGRTVSKVEFYASSQKIGEDTTPSSGLYEMTWQPTRVKAYTLSAVVTDSSGATATSNTRTIMVNSSGGGGGGGGDGDDDDGPFGDPDGDGLNNKEEGEVGSDPESPHSDSDGIPDGEEAMPLEPTVTMKKVPETRYAVIDLGPNDGTYSAGMVNNKGQVAIMHGSQAMFWDPITGWQAIPVEGGTSVELRGLNNNSQVLMKCYHGSQTNEFYPKTLVDEVDELAIWSPTGGLVKLNELNGALKDKVRDKLDELWEPLSEAAHNDIESGLEDLANLIEDLNEQLAMAPPEEIEEIQSAIDEAEENVENLEKYDEYLPEDFDLDALSDPETYNDDWSGGGLSFTPSTFSDDGVVTGIYGESILIYGLHGVNISFTCGAQGAYQWNGSTTAPLADSLAVHTAGITFGAGNEFRDDIWFEPIDRNNAGMILGTKWEDESPGEFNILQGGSFAALPEDFYWIGINDSKQGGVAHPFISGHDKLTHEHIYLAHQVGGAWTPIPLPNIGSEFENPIVNNRLEILLPGTGRFWKNSKIYNSLDEFVDSSKWESVYMGDISDDTGIGFGGAKTNPNGGVPSEWRLVVLVPVEISEPWIDKEGNDTGKLKDEDGLKVAQWEHAWSTEVGHMGDLLDDFIEMDPDRFYVRIPIIGSGTNMKVEISTVAAGGATIDDWAEIEMETDPDDSGMLRSKSQLLVADTPDKKAVGAEDSEEVAKRMHKIALFGKVKIKIEVGGSGAEFELSIPGIGKFKNVSIHPVIVRDSPGGNAVNDAFVYNDIINNVKPVYAQANININVSAPVTVDPPSGVDLEDGLDRPGSDEAIPEEVRKICEQLGTESPDDIYVFYVPFITTPEDGKVAGGFAIVDAFYPESEERYVYNAFVDTSQMNYLTTAHEIGHLLTDLDHIESPYPGLNELPTSAQMAVFQHNLMKGSAVLPRLVNKNVLDSKRLFNEQIKIMRSNSHAH